MTTEDVIYSLERAKDIPNSPAPFTGNVGAIASMKAVDPLTIEFKTKSPTPEFIEQVGLVYIVQKKLAEGKTYRGLQRPFRRDRHRAPTK